jgi:hypothetical protein
MDNVTHSKLNEALVHWSQKKLTIPLLKDVVHRFNNMHMFGFITNLCKKERNGKQAVCLSVCTICNASFLDKGGREG